MAAHLPASGDGEASQKVGYFSNHGFERKKTVMGVVPPPYRLPNGEIDDAKIVPKINQDRILISPKFGGKDDSWLMACYDGNGPKGEQVAEMAAFEIAEQMENADASKMANALKKAFMEANKNICKKAFSASSGTTATYSSMIRSASTRAASIATSSSSA